MVFAVSKQADTLTSNPLAAREVAREERIVEMAKHDPDAAAREMLKMVHATGGTPVAAP